VTDRYPPPSPVADERAASQRSSYLRIGVVIAVLLALLFVILLLVSRQSDSAENGAAASPDPVVSVTPVGPKVVTPDELRAVPEQVGHPVYWAGERDGKELELTVLQDGAVYVRYLPDRSAPGVDKPAFLTVATYRRPDAYALVQGGGSRPGAIVVTDKGGAVVTTESEKATNAYFAFEGTPLLMEVFDPKPGRAFDLVQSGEVQLVQ
jgi:hypothetical protein